MIFDVTSLNEAQKKAVLDTEGAVLVFAGAGSGKTRVLTHRVAYLMQEKQVKPWNILAITFTNKATNEMRERLRELSGGESVWISTFHSLCIKILFRHAEKLGYTESFSVYDETASKKVILQVLREKHLEDDKWKTYLYHISTAKNAGLNSAAYFNEIRRTEKDAMLICEVFDRYQDILKSFNAMDFDDLLIKCIELFEASSEVLTYYQDKFRYIHVDEFQDTNEVQFKIVKLLAGKWGNLFVVGDDDQSIYGWRGANVQNILEFDHTFSDAKVYKLEQNYRSTQAILDCANNLIQNNKARSEKRLFTEKTGGVRVEYLYCPTEYAEVDRVIEVINSLKRNNGYRNEDFAVLVRNNALTRLYEVNFNRYGLKYRVFGGYRFFDRKEILDVIAYFRMLVNPLDNEAVLRIINFPKRGIGDASVDEMLLYAERKGISLLNAILEVQTNTEISSATKNKILPFALLCLELLSKADRKFSEFAEFLVERVGFRECYMNAKKEEEQNRWDNIEEFLSHIQENYGGEDATLSEFLHNVALDSRAEDSDPDSITITTMHAAKGLEFRVVFIIACEEGVLPSSMSFKEDRVDEERRVMYVAVTRAKERLYISCVKGVRTKYNRKENTMPSRFIAESKGEQILPKLESQRGGYQNEYRDDYSDGIPSAVALKQVRFSSNNMTEPPKKIYNTDTSGFAPGKKVAHKRYGIGTVIIVAGEGSGKTVTVAFKDLGVRKFAVVNAPLELL